MAEPRAQRVRRLSRRTGILKPVHMPRDVGFIHPARRDEMGEKPVEKRRIAVGDNPQMHIRQIGCGGLARINVHHTHAGPAFLRRCDPLVKHRMTPGEV